MTALGDTRQLAYIAGQASDARVNVELETEGMTLNIGPQHPATHGTLRVIVKLDGERVVAAEPVMGYMHRGYEKLAEVRTYPQVTTLVNRIDWLGSFANEVPFILAAERLMEVEAPPRAQWIRTALFELSRIANVVLFLGDMGVQLGAVTPVFFAFRDREFVLNQIEAVTGGRFHPNFDRIGGLKDDLPRGWIDETKGVLGRIRTFCDEMEDLVTGNEIFQARTRGIGVIPADVGLSYGLSGANIRASGVDWDLRRDEPYLAYDEVEFDVIVGTHGDAFDRYAIRLNEIRESLRIVEQILDLMPDGDYRTQDKKVTPPPRARIDESMEALIHHFKIFTEGFHVPEGETYAAVESPRGELGCYLVSDGGPKPYRMHIRGPSFVNLQTLPHLMEGGLIADGVAVISSVDPIMGEVDR